MLQLRFLRYFTAFMSIFVITASIIAGGIWTYFALFYSFVMIPVLEFFLEGDESNFSREEEDVLKKDIKFDILVWLTVPMQWLLLCLFLYKVSAPNLPTWELVGYITAFGISCGVFGINVAHELGHRVTWYEQLMSKMLLLSAQYMHFFIEHNRGHHKNVSTDEDPASAKRNEIVYFFWLRSVIFSYLSAWKLENDRVKKLYGTALHWRNEMITYSVVQLLLLVIIFFGFSLKVLLCYLAASLFGILLLETVNYIEHYGLRRKKIEDAYYEKVMPVHSWNSNHHLGRLLLFELSRHSDHHYIASRKYQILRHFDESPQMPTGYPGMMVLSLFPPLWFWVMNKAVDEYKQKQAGEALA